MEEGDLGNDPGKEKAEKAFQEWLALLKEGNTPETIHFLANQDEDVRAGLEQMLGQHKELVEKSKVASKEGPSHIEVQESPSGEKILGDFRLLRELGRGGVGVVWEAEQISLSRRVALKLLAPHLGNNPLFIERFQREAEVGSQISHSAVIQTLSVGEASGTHFIAQELVPGGRTLDDHIVALRSQGEFEEDHYRGVAEFFLKVVEGMASAHELDVVHRDIKPSNILMTEDGEPKVADFGLAKIKDELDFEDSDTEQIVGTPYYMSPEQAVSSKIGVDRRTDIFSLGATLYEMLTLQRAFEGDTGPQVLERILMEDPPDPDDVRARIPVELSIICMKALEKNRKRRYQTMPEFAADLQRFLNNEPIKARKPGPHIRLAKWTRRHPVLSVSGSVAAASFGVVSWLLVENVSARIEAEEARSAAADAAAVAVEDKGKREEVVDFLVSLFRSEGETISAEEVLSRGDFRLKGELSEQPILRARLLYSLGDVYKNLGRYRKSQMLLEEALELRESHLDSVAEELLENQHSLGALMQDLGKFDKAKELLEKSWEGRKKTLGEVNRKTLLSASVLAEVLQLQGDFKGSEQLFRTTLEIERSTLGLEEEETLGTMTALGANMYSQGRYNEAEDFFRQAVDAMKRTLGEDHPTTLTAGHNLGVVLSQLGRHQFAVDVLTEVLEGRRKIYAPEHSWIGFTANALASAFYEMENFREAEPIFEDALIILRNELAESHYAVLTIRLNLAHIYRLTGRFDQAESDFLVILNDYGQDSNHGINAALGLAKVAVNRENAKGAEAWFRKAIVAQKELYDSGHPNILKAEENLAEVLLLQEKFEEARKIVAGLLTQTPSSAPELAQRKQLMDMIRKVESEKQSP